MRTALAPRRRCSGCQAAGCEVADVAVRVGRSPGAVSVPAGQR